MKKYIYLLFAAAMIAGCDKNELMSTSDTDKAAPVELITTFATEPAQNTTFRVMCYDKDNKFINTGYNDYEYYRTGTYRYESTRPRSLMPCKVNADGSYAGIDGADYALAVSDGSNNRYLVLVSPAKMFNTGTVNTFTINRTEAFWATSSKSFMLNGYRILDFGETLKELRSRVDFEFKRGDNVASNITVSNLTLVDAGSTATWVPNTGAITVSGADPVIPMTVTPSATVVAKNTAAEYLFASTYGSNGVKTVKVMFDLTIGSATTTHEKYILAQTLEKMKYYKFSFTVTSETITLVLTVYDLGSNLHDWQSPVIDADALGTPESTLTLGTWTIGNSWDNGGGGSDVIG